MGTVQESSDVAFKFLGRWTIPAILTFMIFAAIVLLITDGFTWEGGARAACISLVGTSGFFLCIHFIFRKRVHPLSAPNREDISALKQLCMLLNHVAEEFTKIFDSSREGSLYQAEIEYYKRHGTPRDQKYLSIFNEWWWATVKPDIESATKAGSLGMIESAIRRLDGFNQELCKVYGPALKSILDSQAAVQCLARYGSTVSKLAEEIKLLDSNGWSFDWHENKLGG